jgi:hypothetical protein
MLFPTLAPSRYHSSSNLTQDWHSNVTPPHHLHQFAHPCEKNLPTIPQQDQLYDVALPD